MRSIPSFVHFFLMCLALVASAFASAAQASEAQCLLAGRVNSDGRWAPQASGMQLLDASGKPLTGATQSQLAAVEAVRLTQPALLAKCDAGQAMADGGAGTGKTPVPALSAGNAPIEVQALATLSGRTGGQWIELRVSVPAERVVMLTR